MAVIQWFPGHMAKALRQVKENLKLVDIVLELVDARLPESSRNPQLEKILENKPSIVVLTKMDLADQKQTAKWVNYYEENGQPAVAINSMQGSLKVIEKKIRIVLAEKLAKKEEKGIINQRIKVMCIGIPNVGKSTLLNHLVKKNVAQVGNKPGVTKAQQWLKAGKNLQLLDTPGILWPKFEDPLVGKKLALTGAIKDSLFNKDDVALYAIEHFCEFNPQALKERYNLSDEKLDDTTVEVLLELTRKMGFKEDYDRGSERLIFDIRKEKLGRYTLDRVPIAASKVATRE
ncbi:ribosome biogenesis GTPase YlqF [Ligilactobacillus sp. WILCCON 0076]|uniref:Ribosome biogenesis GTPase A n=1 Tax=Ligilactobacillus ubinensis TaxID=2876789 RepID=A0A9X2FH46_9LACO|nr:ribosome biogenesis GTPase YlqF [Ligilactobacillus ubinensis]MCP0886147.1 ribosome biogenesis GTPase YlqF [Ligilactobacillus ubinensis]